MGGLNIEYYVAFSATPSARLQDMYKEAWDRGRLPDILKEALIVGLHKLGQDPLDVRLYWPQ